MELQTCTQQTLIDANGSKEDLPKFTPYDDMTQAEKSAFDSRQGIRPGDRERAEIGLTRPALIERRFQVFKKSLCGQQICRDYQTGLTLDEVRAYPYGRLEDKQGAYMWTYSLMNDYPATQKR